MSIKILKQPKYMKYDEQNGIYYQQINWSKIKHNEKYKISLLKGDISCHKDKLIGLMNGFMIKEINKIIFDYLIDELNFELQIGIYVHPEDYDGLISYHLYQAIFYMESYIICMYYDFYTPTLKRINIFNKQKWINYKNINEIVDPNILKFVTDCVYICNDFTKYLEYHNVLEKGKIEK